MKDITSQNIERFVSFVDNAGKIAIVGHMKPDGDALGSTLGMYHYLKLCGKDDVRIIFPHRTQLYLNFLTDRESSKKIIIQIFSTWPHSSSKADIACKER